MSRLATPYQSISPDHFIVSRERLLLRLPRDSLDATDRSLSTKNTVPFFFFFFFLSSGLCSQYHILHVVACIHGYTVHAQTHYGAPARFYPKLPCPCHYMYTGCRHHHHLRVRSRHHIHLGQHVRTPPFSSSTICSRYARSATAGTAQQSTRCDATINHGAKIMQRFTRM
jgi:hypothetical protein